MKLTVAMVKRDLLIGTPSIRQMRAVPNYCRLAPWNYVGRGIFSFEDLGDQLFLQLNPVKKSPTLGGKPVGLGLRHFMEPCGITDSEFQVRRRSDYIYMTINRNLVIHIDTPLSWVQ